jgi:hypothetical protein
MDLSGKTSPQNRQSRDSALSACPPALSKGFFSLSLSLSFAARVERMLRMSFRAGFPFPFPFRGRAFFLFLLFFFLSPLGWFSPPLGGRLHHPEESLFVRVDARGSFIGSNGGSSDGMRHHHQYEYREHAFVGYTEKTKKTKKKCTDAVQMCGSWAQAGECEKNREYMFENCCCGAS